MKHQYQFFGEPLSQDLWKIHDEDEVHHLVKVLRLKEGDVVAVGNGKGILVDGVVKEVTKRQVVVRVTSVNECKTREQKMALGLGVLRAGSIDEIIPSLTELGVDVLHVFQQSGSDRARLSEKAVDRWKKIIRTAVKQSKRAWIPELYVHQSLVDFLAHKASTYQSIYTLDQDAEQTISSVPPKQDGSILVLVGGEKGFDQDEIMFMTGLGCKSVRLSSNVLRSTTAAIAAVAYFATTLKI